MSDPAVTPMTPVDFAKWYMNLTVPLPGKPPATIKVSVYKNYDNYPADADNPKTKDNAPEMVAKSPILRIYRSIRDTTTKLVPYYGESVAAKKASMVDFPPGFDEASVFNVYAGKGSPDEITAVLKLAAVHWPELFQPGALSQVSLQTYCDHFIGLDCNGFAGSYARHMRRRGIAVRASLGPNTYINTFAPPGIRRKAIKDVTRYDAMVWLPEKGGRSRHVALIDTVAPGPPPVKLTIAESASEGWYQGLTVSNVTEGAGLYELKSVSGEEFTIKRGKPPFKEVQVWIAPMW